MGLTDAPQQVNLLDIYPEGTPFVVTAAWVEGVVPTQYGDRTMGKIIAHPVDAPAGSSQEFAVWGSLCEQVQSVSPDELPLTVTVKKEGKRYLFQPAEGSSEPAPAEPTADEKELGVDPGAGEGAAATS
jgi:hypothetical protein